MGKKGLTWLVVDRKFNFSPKSQLARPFLGGELQAFFASAVMGDGCRGVEGILGSRVRREPFHITSWRRPRALGLRAFPKTFTVPAHGQPTRLFFYTDCGEGGDPSAGCRRLQPISSWRVTGCLSNLLRSQLWMGEGGY